MKQVSSWVKCKPENLSEDCVHFHLLVEEACYFVSDKISESIGCDKSSKRCILLYIWDKDHPCEQL